MDIPEEPGAKPLGTVIRAIRLHRGMDQASLAKRLEQDAGESVPASYIDRVEAGAVRLSWERLHLFAKHLHCKPSELMTLAEAVAAEEIQTDADIIARLDAE